MGCCPRRPRWPARPCKGRGGHCALGGCADMAADRLVKLHYIQTLGL